MDAGARHGGYTAAAAWLASDPDNETLIFRKFDNLAALNLLYMQSEILELEERVRQIHSSAVHTYDMDLKDAASTWETLVRQSQPGECFRQDARDNMNIFLELRKKLKDYHEALLLQSRITELKSPDKRVLDTVKHFFERPHHILGGKAKTLFQENAIGDLVALKTNGDSDTLTNFLRNHWHDQEEIARDGVSKYKRFREESISRVVGVTTILVAAVFLVGTIMAFHFVQSQLVKLCLIAGFTTAFAVCLGLITNARRIEIFAATAAYAAVLVVFISNSELSASSGSS